MGQITLTPTTVVDDEIQDEAREAVRVLQDAEPERFVIRTNIGEITLPADLSSFLMGVVQRAATGDAIAIQSLPEELTTTTAAQRLGVSRPTLMKMIKRGELEAYKVGSHTRVKTSTVIEYARGRQDARRAALSEMIRTGYEFSDED
ncbi:helix-turn-helix domain-containing protein [Microbacterium foliorum]